MFLITVSRDDINAKLVHLATSVSYLPGLVGLVTSGGGGLVRGGGLGGAASGASDIVDDGDTAMHRGTAVSALKVKRQIPCGLKVCVLACVCGEGHTVRVSVCSLQVLLVLILQCFPQGHKLPSHNLSERGEGLLASLALLSNSQRINHIIVATVFLMTSFPGGGGAKWWKQSCTQKSQFVRKHFD